MSEIRVSDGWAERFPEACIGLLMISKIDNTGFFPVLEECKRQLEAQLREQYAHLDRNGLQQHPVLAAYRAYYRQFDQTYHVQGQLESIVHKGKGFPVVSPLVDVSFMAELETLVLTASHDADHLTWPLTIDVTAGNESFRQRTGRERLLKVGDMKMVDGQGTVCTILYGQDDRTPVTSATRRVVYVAYAPPGVPRNAVQAQLDRIQTHLQTIFPDLNVDGKVILDADIRSWTETHPASGNTSPR